MAIRLEPNFARGLAWRKPGDPYRALDDFERAVKLDPSLNKLRKRRFGVKREERRVAKRRRA